MPVKKRAGKAKLGYAPLIQQLLNGDAIAYSYEAERGVLDAYFFGWCEGVPPEAIERARLVLDEWREARHAD